jgi:hypothetical protein
LAGVDVCAGKLMVRAGDKASATIRILFAQIIGPILPIKRAARIREGAVLANDLSRPYCPKTARAMRGTTFARFSFALLSARAAKTNDRGISFDVNGGCPIDYTQ